MSGIYIMLIRIVVVIFHYHVGGHQGWLLHALTFMSLSILTLILQPYKKSYMNVLDALLLALMGLLMLLVISFQFVLPSSNEIMSLIIVIVCGFPQLVLLLTVIYRQLKGKWVVQYIAHNVSILLKQTHRQNIAEDEPSDADSLPHRLINPNQYNSSLLSESEQVHTNSTYGSIS